MPQTRQLIYAERPLRQRRIVEQGVLVTKDDIQRFLTAYENLDRLKGTVQHYRRKMQQFYQDLPEDKTIRQGTLKKWQKQIVTVPACLQKELLSYAQKNGVWSGPIFQTRDGRPMHRTYVTAAIRNLCEEAKISGEKGNPKCLRKLYLSTRAGVESNIALLVEQAMERMLEQEQFSVGWEEQ